MWNVTEATIKRKLKNHKNGASRRGIECTLTLEDLMLMFKANEGICDYTGKEMCLLSEDTCEPSLVSLERIDEHSSYCLSNLLLVRRDANYIKSIILENKSTHEPKYKLTHEIKETINKICEVVYNPTRLKEVQSKYNTKKEITKMNEPIEDVKTTNPEIRLAQGYSGLGKLVEKVSTFELTYAQYKTKMNSKKCGLTGKKFNEDDIKCLWWMDKTTPLTKDNSIVTTMKLCTALDKFMVEGYLSLTELKQLCKVVSTK